MSSSAPARTPRVQAQLPRPQLPRPQLPRPRLVAVGALLGSLLASVALTLPASAVPIGYATTVQTATVDGASVRASVTVTASRPSVARTLSVCVWDAADADHSYPVRDAVRLTPAGTTYTATRTFAPGTYRYWACGLVGTVWHDFSSAKTFTVPGPTGVPGRWRLTFADDFTGSALDRTKWSTGWFGSGVTGPVNATEDACYDPDHVRLSDRSMGIELSARAQTCSRAMRRYTTGLITTNGTYSYTYGASEARMYLPADAAGDPLNWPAFWSNGQRWPIDGEIDVMESMGGQTGSHVHSADGDYGFEVKGRWSGWHTFGAVWEPGSVTFYYDGVRVGAVTRGVTASPMYLIVGFGPATGGRTKAARLRVDYVRVWQH